MLTIGRTNYTITKQADDMFTAENNRSTKILVPFADNKDKFYGFNLG